MSTPPHESSRPEAGEDAVAADELASAELAADELASAELAADELASGELAAEEVEHDLDSLLAAAHRERDEYLGMLQRVQADFENYKKRMVRQQTELLERAAESLVVKLLPVLEVLDLARAHMGDGEEASVEGKAMLQASALMSDILAKEGLERIDDVDGPFDPTSHDAVEHDPSLDGESGTVSGVLRAGYRWKGRVIRPAMVRVRG